MKKNTAYYISLLRSYPLHKKNKRRKPHLKAKFIGNRKVFFEVFIQKITQDKYNTRDKRRRLILVENLSQIFAKNKPLKIDTGYMYVWDGTKIIIKEAKDNTLHLLTIYPK